MFRRWTSSTTAAHLHKAAGKAWTGLRDDVIPILAASPHDAVLFGLVTLKEPEPCALARAQQRPHLGRGCEGHEKVDPVAVLPVHQRLVEKELVEADAQHYRLAARRRAKMRKLAAGSEHAAQRRIVGGLGCSKSSIELGSREPTQTGQAWSSRCGLAITLPDQNNPS